MAKIEGTITAGAGLKVRAAPESNAGFAAPALPYQTKITGDEVTNSVGEKWIKLISVNGVPVTYVGYSSMLYIRVDKVTTDPPPVPSEPVLYPESAVWEYVEPSTGQTKRIQYKFEKVLP